jgi:S-adenosylmethionine hydrolase
VGTERHALVVEHEGRRYVGPDNGLFSLVAPCPPGAARAVDRVPPDWHVHPTFHGRDLFARVAARLAAGAPVEDFARTRVTPRRLDVPAPEDAHGERLGEVLHVDRFGNLVTNVTLAGLGDADALVVEIGGAPVPLGRTYHDVERGRLVAYLGSAGYLEVGVRDGSAAALLGAGRGARLRVRPKT